jgi:hypothetical protein
MSAMQQLDRVICSLGDKLKAAGLDNIVVVREKGDDLAVSVRQKADETNTAVANIVVVAARATLEAKEFNDLRSAPGIPGAVLFGIDLDEIKRYYRESTSSTDLMDVDMLKVLSMALAIAAGDEPPAIPELTYDEMRRIFVYLPKAAPVKYEDLIERNRARRAALVAA